MLDAPKPTAVALNALPHHLTEYELVVISPHFDDAALSLGAYLSLEHRRTLVVTVHGGPPLPGAQPSDWDVDCGFADGAEAHEIRSGEDQNSCGALGVHALALPQADGPYCDAVSFAGLGEVLIAIAPRCELLVPLGVNQPDHRAVRNEVLDIIKHEQRSDLEVSWYADLPYSASVPGWSVELDEGATGFHTDLGTALAEVEDRVGPLDRVVSLEVHGELWTCKRAAVLAHASQLSMIGAMDEISGVGALLAPNGPLRIEMLWSIAGSARPATSAWRSQS